MSLNRPNAKRDKNEPEIVNALKAKGVSVVRLSDPNTPDLLCSYRNITCLMEVKTKGGALTKGQKEFIKDWQGLVFVIRSAEEAVTIIDTISQPKLPIYAFRSSPLSWHIE